jgi:hypothetical protein
MIRCGVLFVLLLYGCTTLAPTPPPRVLRVTTFRAIPGACNILEEQLKDLTKERDAWKRYALTLEKLP